MKYGVSIFPTEYSIRPDDLAGAVEALGFESLFVCEHTHAPLDTEAVTGRAVVDEFFHTLDPFVALTAAASATSTLLLGTAVCLVVIRDPIHLAKEVASVDFLSGGRFLFGIGGGWNLPEMRNHGTRPEIRWRLLAERVAAMKAIWREDVAEFHGDFVDFDPMRLYPKPVQQPCPPVLVGGVGPRTLQRVIEYGDGWIPRALPVEDLRERIATLRQMEKEAGRPPMPVTVFAAPTAPETLDAFEAMGVERVLFGLASTGRDEILRRLDELAGARR